MKVFKEEQRFTQTWLIILLIVSAITPFILIIKEYNNDKMSLTSLITTIALIILSLGLIFFFKLTTKIDENGIHYQFFPFHFSLKTIAWTGIISAKVRKYDALSEYGGWGLKGGLLWNKSKGKAMNVSGDMGIQLELKNGKKLLIGTQKENDAKRVIETYQKTIKVS